MRGTAGESWPWMVLGKEEEQKKEEMRVLGESRVVDI